jgi:4'-phosphopantetheinyl transferase
VYRVNFITKRSAFSPILRIIEVLNSCRLRLANAVASSDAKTPKSGRHAVPGVRIWYVAHGSNSKFEDHETALTKSDLDEFASVRHAETRQRSLATRAVLRRALSECVGGKVAPNAWRFDRTENGQPILRGGENNLKFSCSHTPRMSVIAVSTGGEVGVDIADASFEFAADWLDDVMSARERRALERVPRSKIGRAVSRLWTLKEAYVKMLGTGIAEVADVAFDLSDDRLLAGGSSGRFIQPVLRTWIVGNQGHRYSVALASCSLVASRAPLIGCLSEGSGGYSRNQFSSLAG